MASGERREELKKEQETMDESWWLPPKYIERHIRVIRGEFMFN